MCAIQISPEENFYTFRGLVLVKFLNVMHTCIYTHNVVFN